MDIMRSSAVGIVDAVEWSSGRMQTMDPIPTYLRQRIVEKV